MPSKGVVAGLALTVAVGFALAAAQSIASYRRGTPADRAPINRPAQVTGEGYAASGRCQSCHPSQYDSWHQSFHRTMTQVATPSTVLADFGGRTVAEVQGRAMTLERRGDEFWATFDEPDWDRSLGARPRITRQIVMITGAHHQQVYWYGTGRGAQLGQLPATYLVEERRWIPRRMVFLQPPMDTPPSTTGSWNSLCINCHATHGKPRLHAGTEGAAATTAAEFGIACEACHGPGEEHARLNQNPVTRYARHVRGEGDATIVEPTRLDPRGASQVCGQCHGVWMHADAGAEERADRDGLSYRPGRDVAENRTLVRPSVDLGSPRMRQLLAADPEALTRVFWSDGMVRVSGREYNGLVDSPCFARATTPERTLTCFSCHSMHTGATDSRETRAWAAGHQMAAGKDGNAACLQCHQPIARALDRHTRHAPGSTGSECVNCHMPYTSYGLLKGIRSHQIASPTAEETVRTGRPNACNGCHLDKTLAWTAERLQTWYGQAPPSLSTEHATVASGVLLALTGDAGQRALTAWAMGWRPAQEASGTAWMAPVLSVLIDDPYDAVRFIAARSLRSVPAFERYDGDFLAPPASRQANARTVLEQWQARSRATDANPALLITRAGALDTAALDRLLRQRNHRPVSLNE